jgi:hypothetical protein
VADTRHIPTIGNEQLELLTQLRLAQTSRNNMRRDIIREARMITRKAINIQIEYATNGQPPRALMLRGLRQWLEALIRNMQVLRAEEEAAREREAEIWSNIQ